MQGMQPVTSLLLLDLFSPEKQSQQSAQVRPVKSVTSHKLLSVLHFCLGFLIIDICVQITEDAVHDTASCNWTSEWLCALSRPYLRSESQMAKKRKSAKRPYKVWTSEDLRALKQFSRERAPVRKVARALRRTEATIRMKAYSLGIPMGHRRRNGTKRKARAA